MSECVCEEESEGRTVNETGWSKCKRDKLALAEGHLFLGCLAQSMPQAHACLDCLCAATLVLKELPCQDQLLGLVVVKASASRVEDPGFKSRL